MKFFDILSAFVVLALSKEADIVETSGYKQVCPKGLENIHDSPLGACYALVDPSMGPMDQKSAENECQRIDKNAHLVVMTKLSYLETIRDWAISKGLPTDSSAGFWLGFTRQKSAKLDADGTLSDAAAAIRKDGSLFQFWLKQYPLRPHLWRNSSQPGDQTDERDEMCTAQKKPGSPEFLGIDDYPCYGDQLHYAVCIYWQQQPQQFEVPTFEAPQQFENPTFEAQYSPQK